MTRRALPHAYSAWVDDPMHPDGPYMGEARQVFQGRMRIVRNPRRARLLKRRGVELDCYTNPMGLGGVAKRFWVWFETLESVEARQLVKRLRGRVRSLRTLPSRIERTLDRAYGPGNVLDEVRTWDKHTLATLHADLRAHGYALRLGVVTTTEARARMSPPLTLYYNAIARDTSPHPFERPLGELP